MGGWINGTKVAWFVVCCIGPVCSCVEKVTDKRTAGATWLYYLVAPILVAQISSCIIDKIELVSTLSIVIYKNLFGLKHIISVSYTGFLL